MIQLDIPPLFPIRPLERLAPHKKSRNGAGEMFWGVDQRPHDKRKYLSPKDTALGKRKGNPGMRTGTRSNWSEEKNSGLQHQTSPPPVRSRKTSVDSEIHRKVFGLPASGWLLHSTLRRAKRLLRTNGYRAWIRIMNNASTGR